MVPPVASPLTVKSPSSNDKPLKRSYAIPLILFLAIFLVCFFWYIGKNIVRVWYYGGRVHGDFQVYDIRPVYTHRRIEPRASDSSCGNEGQKDTLSRRESSNVPMHAQARQELNEDDVDDLEQKKQIREPKRISRLPIFVQDDRGDAREFPGVPYGIQMQDFNRHFEIDCSKLGLQKVVDQDWLVVDRHFHHHHMARKELLKSKLSECVQKMPAINEEDPSEELLPEVANFLLAKFPVYFVEEVRNGVHHVRIDNSAENLVLSRPYFPEAMEMLARLGNEDFVFFRRQPFTARWQLCGGAVCFPSGWNLKRLLGGHIDQLEEVVLSWNSKSLFGINRDDMLTCTLDLTAILDCVEQSKDWMMRSTVFIQTDPGNRDLHELFFIQAPHHFFPGSVFTLNPRDMIVRKEVQTFRMLPNSRCIVMTVKTELRHLIDLKAAECADLATEIRGWPKEMAVQKGRDLWKRVVLGYLERKSRTQDDGMMAEEGEFTEGESD